MKKLIRNIKMMYYQTKMNYWQRKVKKYLLVDDYDMVRHSITMRYMYNDKLLDL